MLSKRSSAIFALFVAGILAWIGFAWFGSQTIPSLYSAQSPGFVGGVWRGAPDFQPHTVTRYLLTAGLVVLTALICLLLGRATRPLAQSSSQTDLDRRALLAARHASNPSARSLYLLGLILLVFVALASLFWDFVVDDAYITFRFGQNLALGHGIVWNPGEAPVEGFTSFLAMLLSALAQLLRVNPVFAAKACGLAAACGTIWLLDRRGAALPWGIRLALASGVALSPAFAFHAMHGMETAMSAFLVLVTGAACLDVLNGGGRWSYIGACGGALAAFLSRPDTAACTAVCLLGTGLFVAVRRERRAAMTLAAWCAGTGIVWALFMVWRKSYFGSWLPNTFQVKVARGAGFFKPEGSAYAFDALIALALPFVALLVAAIVLGADRKKLAESVPLLLGTGVFGLYLCTIVPIQGFLSRFAFPVLPVLLLAVAHAATGSSLAARFTGRRRWSAALALLFCGWAARQLAPALDLKEDRTQYDRVLVGQRLSSIPGTMLASESGALPFLSGWKSVDTLGLVSEEIARQGLSVEILQRRDPDLVMLSNAGRYRPLRAVHPYMTSRGFVPVAAVHKSRGMYHYYFVRSDSPYFERIREAVVGVPSLRYGDLTVLLRDNNEGSGR